MKHLDILAPVLVLFVFAVLVPVALPLPQSVSSDKDCSAATSPSRLGEAGLGLLERCSALHPRDVGLLAALGDAYEAANAPSRAEAAYQRALALDTDFADLRLTLGRLLLRRGAAAEAARQAALGLQIQPNRRALLELQSAADQALCGSAR